MIQEVQAIDEVLSYVWHYSQQEEFASYPRSASFSILQDDLIKAIASEQQQVIACYKQNQLMGVCSYFWKSDERYAQTTQFIIHDEFEAVATECIRYIQKQLPEYTCLFGFPLSNQAANHYFLSRNVKCLESSVVLQIKDWEPTTNAKHPCITRIDREHFDDYALFHDTYAIPLGMYYTSRHLRKEIDQFRIFAYRQDGMILGSVFVYATANLSEIFGVFVNETVMHRGVETALLRHMLSSLHEEFGGISKILYFVEERSIEELDCALKVGFVIMDHYRCYQVELNNAV